jgi:tRNA-splicing ligase RtcB
MNRLGDKIVTFLDPDAIEPEARTQLENIAELPFVFKHIAVMPDCHLGKGATVGSVIATEGAIIPAAVGVTSAVA